MFLDLYCLQGGFGVMFTVLLLAFTKNYGQSGPPMPYVLSALVDVARTSLYGAHASWSLHGVQQRDVSTYDLALSTCRVRRFTDRRDLFRAGNDPLL
jgi:hypothetical protein